MEHTQIYIASFSYQNHTKDSLLNEQISNDIKYIHFHTTQTLHQTDHSMYFSLNCEMGQSTLTAQVSLGTRPQYSSWCALCNSGSNEHVICYNVWVLISHTLLCEEYNILTAPAFEFYDVSVRTCNMPLPIRIQNCFLSNWLIGIFYVRTGL